VTGSLLAVLVAGLAALIVTRLAELVARRRSLLDVPTERSSHSTPTPRIGGLGIAAGVVAGWVAIGGWTDSTSTVLVLAAVALAAIGLLDDLWRTSVLGKYLAQMAAAVVSAVALAPVVRIGVADIALTLEGPVAIGLVAVGLTALVNAVNFMDGIDGLIGAVAMVVAVVGIAFAGPAGWPLFIPIAGACAGFLVWNWAPASIFMGDAGSQFLGLLLGTALLAGSTGSTGSPGSIDVVPIAILVAPLLFDTGFTLIRRARAGRDLFAGHREHLYQRLVHGGVAHRSVAAGYAAATAVTGILALAWAELAALGQAVVLVGLFGVGMVFAAWVSQREREAAAAMPAA